MICNQYVITCMKLNLIVLLKLLGVLIDNKITLLSAVKYIVFACQYFSTLSSPVSSQLHCICFSAVNYLVSACQQSNTLSSLVNTFLRCHSVSSQLPCLCLSAVNYLVIACQRSSTLS